MSWFKKKIDIKENLKDSVKQFSPEQLAFLDFCTYFYTSLPHNEKEYMALVFTEVTKESYEISKPLIDVIATLSHEQMILIQHIIEKHMNIIKH